MTARVLVVDDERKMRRVLQIVLEQMGLESVAAESAEEALRVFHAQRIDLVLTDLKMPGMSGVDLLERIRAVNSEVPVVVLTAYGTVETAVAAMKQGAFDYILKPFDVPAMEIVIRSALDAGRYRTDQRFLKQRIDPTRVFEGLVGDCPAMQRVYDAIRQVSPAKTAVLITGETGTGKELVARAIHSLSPRREKRFVALNCAAIPPELLESELFGHVRGAFTGAHVERTGKFELADGGTLFLDEIGDMAYALQAKLLRVLQEGVIERIGSNQLIPVDVRVVSSTNRNLVDRIAEGHFREDLYYRLNVLHIHLPPLRERGEDIADLARFYLAALADEMGKGPLLLTPEACQLLARHSWPGNVRELRNLMERAAVLSSGSEIDPAFVRLLMPQLGDAAESESAEDNLQLDQAVEDLERKLILKALSATRNKAEAARLLGVSERTLWYKLKRYGL